MDKSNMLNKNNMFLKDPFLLLLIIIIGLIIRIFFLTGMRGVDDLQQINFANSILNNSSLNFTWFAAFRIGFYLPYIILFKIFSFSEISALIFPISFSLIGLIATFYITIEIYNRKTAYIALILLVFLPIDIITSSYLYPDTPSATLFVITVFLVYKASSTLKISNIPLLIFLSGLIIGYTYLIRLTGFFILPFVIFLMYKKKLINFYYILFLGVLLIICFEMIYYKLTLNNWFARWSTLLNTNTNITPSMVLNNYNLIKKLILDYSSKLFYPNKLYYFGFYIYVSIGLIFTLSKNNIKKIRTPFLWFFSLFILINFFPASIKPFRPIYTFFLIRYMLPLGVPLTIITSYIINESKIQKKYKLGIITLLILSNIVFLTVLHSNENIGRCISYNERKIAEWIKSTNPKTIVTDWRTKQFVEFFIKDSNIKIYSFENFNSSIECPHYVILNNRTINNFKIYYKNEFHIWIPNWVMENQNSWNLIIHDRYPISLSIKLKHFVKNIIGIKSISKYERLGYNIYIVNKKE